MTRFARDTRTHKSAILHEKTPYFLTVEGEPCDMVVISSDVYRELIDLASEAMEARQKAVVDPAAAEAARKRSDRGR